MRLFRAPLFFALFTLLSFGCGDSKTDPTDGKQCVRTADCEDGEHCKGGTCVTGDQSCNTFSDCALDEYCLDGSCALSSCEDNEGCGSGFVCLGLVCREGCRSDEECGDGQTCSSAAVCETLGCTTGSCPRFQSCDMNASPSSCEYNGDCESDAECVAFGAAVGDGEEYICSTGQQKCVIKPPCGEDSDCKNREICEPRMDGRKVCRSGCRDNGGCRAGQICDVNNLLCVNGCNDNSDCPAVGETVFACVSRFCIPTCETRNDCSVGGQVCAGNPSTCNGCATDGQCPATEFCDFTKGATPEEEINPASGLCEPLPPSCPDDGFGNNHDENTPFSVSAFPYETTAAMAPLLCRDKAAGEWFSFAVGSNQIIEIELQYDTAVGNMDVALRRVGGGELIASARPPTGDNPDNGKEIIRYGVELSGQFLVQVRGNLIVQNAPYQIKINVAAPAACTDDALEPNNANMPATLMPETDFTGLQVCGDDTDFYNLEVLQNQVVKITAQAPSNLGNIDLFLRDSAQQIVKSATTTQDKEVLEVEIDTAGIYVLEVRVAGSVGIVDYDLEWSQRDNNCADPFEVNNTCPSGVALNAGTHSNLNVCDDGDWYEIQLLPLQEVTIKATYDRAISAGDLDTSLFGPNDCATLVSAGQETQVGNTTVVEEVITYQAQTGGLFNLQVFLFAGVQAEYDLEVIVVDGPACIDDGQEPNNDAATAVTIDRAGANAGTDNIITGLRVCDSDEDWFTIDLIEGDVLDWQVSFLTSAGDLDVELIGPNNLVLANANSITDNETLSYTVGAGEAGTYALKVFGKFPTRNDYWVITTLNGTGPADPLCPDALENNDTFADAVSVGAGTTGLLVCGNPRDDDYFKTTLQPGERLDVTLNFTHAAGNINLVLFDEGMAQLASSRTLSDTETVGFLTARARELTWQINTSGQVVTQPYNMNVVITPASLCDEDAFANPTQATAATVAAPGLYSGLQICENTADWFKTSFEAGKDAQVFINFDGDQADLDLSVYAADGMTLVASGVATGDDEMVDFTPGTTGNYFIKVQAKVPSRIAYDLLLYADTDGDGTLEGPEDKVCPDIFENNDTRGAARSLPVGNYSDLLLCWEGLGNTDNDWYSIFVPAGGTVTATMNFQNSLGNLSMRLYRGSSPTVADQSITMNDVETVTSVNAGNGEQYFVHIFGVGTGFSNHYDLDIELSFADVCIDDAISGATQGTAVEQGTGSFALTLCEGSEDWIKLPAGTTALSARFELKNRLGNIDVELWDANGPVASSTSTSNSEIIDMVGLAGNHFLRVFPTDGAFIRNNYDLWLEINNVSPSAPYCPDPYEYDDQLGAGESFSGTVQLADPISCGADEDWFQMTGLRSGFTYQLATFYSYSASADLTLEVTDANGLVLDTGDSAVDDELLTFTPAANGNYFARITNNGTGQAAYDLLVGRDSMYSFNCPEDTFDSNGNSNDNTAGAALVGAPVRLALGACSTNDDYFKFVAPTTGPMTIEIAFDGAQLNLDLQITGPGTFEFKADNMGNRESATINVTAGSTYFVSVQRASTTNNSGPYFLHIK